MKTFEDWLKLQNNRDDVVGDLSKDYLNAGGTGKLKESKYWQKYRCDEANSAYDLAHSEWEKTNEKI